MIHVPTVVQGLYTMTLYSTVPNKTYSTHRQFLDFGLIYERIQI